MAFAVVCKSCQSRFLLNDDLLKRRVAGRVVTVRCRQCHASIEVDASQIDTQKATAPEPEAKAAAPEPVVPRPLPLKATPSPPRPTKSSTLIGIGGPPRPPGSTELVALSPGLLNVSNHDPSSAALDFPEPPPPPPSSVPLEELNADEWEIAETPPLPRSDAAPESVDDFIEELPPSIPPPADEEPTALIPARQLLEAAKLAEGSASAGTASREAPVSVDLTSLDVPLENPKNTLPLFGLEDSHAVALPTAPKPPTKPKPPSPSAAPSPTPSPAEGSLSPASLDPPPSTDRPDSGRTRKNVVAPATSSVPPPGERKRSGLAIPILAGLAIAAGVLIYKRGEAPPQVTAAQAEHATTAEPAAPVAATEPTAPAATTSTSVVAAEPGDDMTFETAPSAATPKVAVAPPHHERAGEPKSQTPKPEPQPKSEPAASPASEPVPAIAKTEPTPREPAPTGPVGDFDPSAAAAALTAGAAQASACRKEGDPSGVASVVITFAPSGRVTSANVSGPPFAGTPTGGCIAAALRKARVPPFDGDRVTVSKTIVIQ
jgi:predicted Zn finger-like uncharacterized protein